MVLHEFTAYATFILHSVFKPETKKKSLVRRRDGKEFAGEPGQKSLAYFLRVSRWSRNAGIPKRGLAIRRIKSARGVHLSADPVHHAVSRVFSSYVGDLASSATGFRLPPLFSPEYIYARGKNLHS